MKKYLLVLTTFFTLTVKAQQCDNIYGLDFSGSDYFLVSLDTTTGITTLIDTLVGVVSFNAGSSTFDANSGNYIFQDPTGLGIVVVNSANGNIVNSYLPNPYRTFCPEFNPNTGKIIGLDFSGSDYFLVSLDTTTGITTLIDTLVGVVSFNAGSSTFDANSGNYIFQDPTGLGIAFVNSANGSIVNSYLPNPYKTFCPEYYKCEGTGLFETSTRQKNELTVYPNPFFTQTTLHIDNFLKNATLTVDNCFGQTVKQIKNISGQTITLHRDNLPSGLYFLRLTQANKIFITGKLVITDN